jgi:hypothetical protein
VRTDRRKDGQRRHDEPDGRFSQFCETKMGIAEMLVLR